MIVVIRIAGIVDINSDIQEALYRLYLKRKYSATIIKPTQSNIKLLKKIRNFVAYGDIDKETLFLLIKNRAELKNKSKKLNVEKIIEELEKKDLKKLEIKPYFRLHPPRGGIDSKKNFGVGKGVLGDNKEKINGLVRRML